MIKMKRLIAAVAATLLISPLASASAELVYRLQRYVPELALDMEQFVDDELEGIILAPNGYSCRLPTKDGFCTIPLIWVTGKENHASLWRTDPDVPSLDQIATGYDGYVQAYVRYEQELFYELKDGKAHADTTLAEATLTAEWDDAWLVTPPPPRKEGQLSANNNGNCEIQTNETFCHVRMTWETQHVETATVWQKTSTGLNRVSESAPDGSLMAIAFSYPVVYELREGTSEGGDMLAAAMTRGFASQGTGLKPPHESNEDSGLPDDKDDISGKASGNPSCLVNFQRGSCMLPIDYAADYPASLWDARLKTKAGGGYVQGRLSVTAFNYDGAPQSANTFELRVHGNAKAYYSDPMVDRLTVMAIRPNHTGSLTPVTSSDCIINPSRTSCNVQLDVQSTSPIVTVWDRETGALISQVTPPRTLTVKAVNGVTSYVLREGTDRRNDILDEQEVKGDFEVYGTFFQGSQNQCTAPIFAGRCSVPVSVIGTEDSSLFRRDISSTTPGEWQLISSNATNRAFSIDFQNVRGLRKFELEIRSSEDPKKIYDNREVSADVGPKHSFTLNRNSLPGQNGTKPCTTFFNSDYCYVNQSLYWQTSAENITACISNGSAGYTQRLGWSKQNPTYINTGSVHHYPDRQPSYVDFYEGALSACPQNQAAGKANFRLLDTLSFGQADRLTIENTPAKFRNSSPSCVVYSDTGTCNVNASLILDKMGFRHASIPEFYVSHLDGAFISNAEEGSSIPFRMTVSDDQKTYNLRVMRGNNRAVSDPVIGTLTTTIKRARYSGSLFVSKQRPTLTTMVPGNQKNSNYPPYFSQRNGEDPAQAQGCAIHYGETLCDFFVSFTISAYGAAPSLTIDGNDWKTGSGPYLKYINSPMVSRGVTTSTVQLWDGDPATSQVIDSLEVISFRPEYTLQVTNLVERQELGNFGQLSDIKFNLMADTNAYVYNKTTDEVLCQTAFARSDEVKSKYTGCRIQSPPGVYDIEYRLGKIGATNFTVRDSKSVEIIYNQKGEGEIKPDTTYPQYFTTCPQNFVEEKCRIYYEYKIGDVDSPVGTPSACLINQNGAIVKSGTFTANGKWIKANRTIDSDIEQIWVADGSTCPANMSDTSIPILLKHQFKSEVVEPVIEYSIDASSNAELDEATGLILCPYLSQGAACHVTINAKNMTADYPGQDSVLQLNGYFNNVLDSKNGTNTYSKFVTAGYALSGSTNRLSVVGCKTKTKTQLTWHDCPREKILKEFTIRGYLPEYTGKITPVNGTTCETSFEGSTCTIEINIDIDGSHASLYVDGKYVSSVSRSEKNYSVTIPVKANSAPTEVLIRDGINRTSAHRMLDSINLTALPYDDSRFKFTNKPYLNNKFLTLVDCVVSTYDASNRVTSCAQKLTYTSDTEKKTIHLSNSNNVLATVQGNGSVEILGSLRPAPKALNASNATNISHYVAKDSNSGELLGRMAVYGVQTEIEERPITIFGNIKSVTRSTMTVRYQGSYWAATGTNAWNLSTQNIVDDLKIKAPDQCYIRNTNINYVCAAVPYLTTKLHLPSRTLSRYTIGIPESENKKVKRFYYRVTSAVSQHVSDPVVSINGTVRPLIMDGLWHYIDTRDALGSTLQVSIMSATDNNLDIDINWTAEVHDRFVP